jgi:hypothetical protein
MSTAPYSLRNKAKSPPPISQGSDDKPNQETSDIDKSDTEASIGDTPTPATNLGDQVDETASQASSAGTSGTPVLYFWDGVEPTPQGHIATWFTDNQPDDEDFEQLVHFLYTNKEENKANKLQFDTKLFPFIAAVPDSIRKVRVVYGVGSSIGLTGMHSNEFDDKVLALSGEHETDITYPSVLQFPQAALTPTSLKTPSFIAFQRELKARNKKGTWFKYDTLVDQAKLPMLVPAPSPYVVDGFDCDLDAAVIFERLDEIPTERQETLQATLHLLRTFLTAVVSKYKKSDPTIIPPSDTYMAQPASLLNKWKRSRMQKLFPTYNATQTAALPATTASNAPTPQPITPAPAPTSSDWSPEAFMKALATFNKATTQASRTETVTETTADTEQTLGLGKFAYNQLLDLCGLDPSTADEINPLWKQLAEKNLTKSDKLAFVRRAIENRIKWSEAKVLPLNSILTMVIQRAWEGETTLSSLTSAAKGLTPFAVPCLSESEVTTQNDLADALDAASSTTVKDHSSIKLVASAPKTFDGLVKRIKRFGNLLFAIFDDTSALFMQIEDMIIALDAYGEYARSTMSHQTIASILWITHLQSRHYSAGAMKGEKAIKAEFTNMMNAITTKAPVIHMDTPPSLFTPKTTFNTPTKDKDQDTPQYESPNKKQKGNENNDKFKLIERNVMNTKVKIAMAPILALDRIPNMGKLCRAVRANVGDLFPKHKDLCIRSQILGKCFSSCTHKHSKLNDNDVETALKILKPIIDNPSLVKVN